MRRLEGDIKRDKKFPNKQQSAQEVLLNTRVRHGKELKGGEDKGMCIWHQVCSEEEEKEALCGTRKTMAPL